MQTERDSIWQGFFATVLLEITARNNDMVDCTVCLSQYDIPPKLVMSCQWQVEAAWLNGTHCGDKEVLANWNLLLFQLE